MKKKIMTSMLFVAVVAVALLRIFAGVVFAESEADIRVIAIEATATGRSVEVTVDYKVIVEGSLDFLHSRVTLYAKKDGGKDKIIGSGSDLNWSEEVSSEVIGVTLEPGDYLISAVVSSGGEWRSSGSTRMIVR